MQGLDRKGTEMAFDGEQRQGTPKDEALLWHPPQIGPPFYDVARLCVWRNCPGRRLGRPESPRSRLGPQTPLEVRGPRSEPRAPMQMVSGSLGSLGFRGLLDLT